MKFNNIFKKNKVTCDWPDRMILYSVLTMTKSLLEIESREESLYGHSAKNSLKVIDQAIGYYHNPELNEYPDSIKLEFAPTGAIQELSMANGWDKVYLKLAEAFDQTYKTL